jgi:hypothetical protein
VGAPAPDRFHGSAVLRKYGFLITDETSVEVSMVGSLVYHGGLVGLGIGGLLLGFFHLILSRTIAAQAHFSDTALALTGGIVATNAWAYNVDIISHAKIHVWTSVYIAIVAAIARLCALRNVRRPSARHRASALIAPRT